MKLVSREPGKLVFRLDSRENDALRAVLSLRTHLPRGGRPLTADTAIQANLQAAQQDLQAALSDHRRELSAAVEALLTDSNRCTVPAKGACLLTLSEEDTHLLLQSLNDARVAAWEKLGCPDFEAGGRPEVNEENFLCLWTLQATDLFQGLLLAGLMGDD